ncbi:HPr family phosphocarrier protein [Chlamydiota bacterium]
MGNMITKEFEIQNRLGLHARPAAMFVKIANDFNAEIFLEKNGEKVNGKSIMGIMMLAASRGTKVRIIVDGDDALDAMNELEKLLSSKFGEE